MTVAEIVAEMLDEISSNSIKRLDREYDTVRISVYRLNSMQLRVDIDYKEDA